MILRFTDAAKGKPYRLFDPIDNYNDKLKIGLKRVYGRVGWYNIEEELEWRYRVESNISKSTIQPGLYSFDDMTKVFTDEIDGLEIDVDAKTAKITMNIPENHEIWIPDRIKKIFGLDDDNPLSLGYTGDHPVEFSPRRIAVYLRQLSTTGNFLNGSTSNLLDFIPLTDVPFGEYFSVDFAESIMQEVNNGVIHEIDFDFKVEFRDRVVKLDNHEQPLDLVLEIK